MNVPLTEIDTYVIEGLWHWEYGPFGSEDGFETQTEALDDAEEFLDGVTQDEYDDAVEEAAELDLEINGLV